MHFQVLGFWSGYTDFDEISQPIELKPRGWAQIEDILEQIMNTFYDEAVNLCLIKN